MGLAFFKEIPVFFSVLLYFFYKAIMTGVYKAFFQDSSPMPDCPSPVLTHPYRSTMSDSRSHPWKS